MLDEVCRIPFGATASYKDSAAIGMPTSTRAVGRPLAESGSGNRALAIA